MHTLKQLHLSSYRPLPLHDPDTHRDHPPPSLSASPTTDDHLARRLRTSLYGTWRKASRTQQLVVGVLCGALATCVVFKLGGGGHEWKWASEGGGEGLLEDVWRIRRTGSDLDLDLDVDFHETGYLPLPSSILHSSPLLPSPPSSPPIPPHLALFTDACATEWVVRGTLCASLNERGNAIARAAQGEGRTGKVDAVWTWVNGSSERHRDWREFRDSEGRSERKRKPGENRFADHDELRHSLRSVFYSLPSYSIRSFTILTTGFPLSLPSYSTIIARSLKHWLPSFLLPSSSSPSLVAQRESQIPTWLSRPRSQGSNDTSQMEVVVRPHWEVFRTAATADIEEARRWREEALPTFNSMAIEAMLGNAVGGEEEERAGTLLYFNDDYFLMQEMSIGDFTSPLYGTNYRMYRGLDADGIEKGASMADGEGEWPSMQYANWLLDRRFGKRPRPYLLHVTKTLYPPALSEIGELWPKEIAESGSMPFRGRNGTEVNIAFFSTFYHIERHREALLWSFFYNVLDSDHDGIVSSTELSHWVESLSTSDGSMADMTIKVRRPRRRSIERMVATHEGAGWPKSKVTTTPFTSADGYGLAFLGDPAWSDRASQWPDYKPDGGDQFVCELNIAKCFGTLRDQSTTRELFARNAFAEPIACGDCLITALVGESGEIGLQAFFPVIDLEEGRGATLKEWPTLPMSQEWEADLIAEDDPFDVLRDVKDESSRAAIAARLVQRWAYSIGDTQSSLVMLMSTEQARQAFSEILPDWNAPPFLAINDDLPDEDRATGVVEGLFEDWMEAFWPSNRSDARWRDWWWEIGGK